MQMEADGKAVPILCYGIKREVGLIDMDAPLLIGESDFERLGWKLSRSETSKGEDRENKVAVTDSPEENQMETRFWENDIMGAGTIPTEDEMPRTLEFNPIVEDVDKSKWPAGLLREVERLPRAFSEKDLAEPANLGTIEFEFSKDIPEQIPPLYVPKMHDEREKLVETRLQALIDSGIYEEGTSTFGSAWITVAKPNKPGEFRDCIDNRGITEFVVVVLLVLQKQGGAKLKGPTGQNTQSGDNCSRISCMWHRFFNFLLLLQFS